MQELKTLLYMKSALLITQLETYINDFFGSGQASEDEKSVEK